ncbi:MAG TPA: hypothetical protein VE177_06705 [Candidatus Binatus sp.]|nr:hypothetical protein [Candidatus Binatus sp.]
MSRLHESFPVVFPLRLASKMSQSRHGPREIEVEREDAEEDVKAITAQLKKTNSRSAQGRLLPFLLGWKINCPHCGDQFIVSYQDDGTFELRVAD